MAVKQTANLIPMCHTLLISKCEIAYEDVYKRQQLSNAAILIVAIGSAFSNNVIFAIGASIK